MQDKDPKEPGQGEIVSGPEPSRLPKAADVLAAMKGLFAPRADAAGDAVPQRPRRKARSSAPQKPAKSAEQPLGGYPAVWMAPFFLVFAVLFALPHVANLLEPEAPRAWLASFVARLPDQAAPLTDILAGWLWLPWWVGLATLLLRPDLDSAPDASAHPLEAADTPIDPVTPILPPDPMPAPEPAPRPASAAKRPRRPRRVGYGLWFGLVALAIGVLALGAWRAISSLPASPTPALLGMIATEATEPPFVLLTAEATAEPPFVLLTAEATAEPTAAPTRRVTGTPRPTQTPRVVVDAGTPPVAISPVVLRYDDEQLVLFNRSGRTVNVREWEFVQTRASGEPLTFRATRWAAAVPETLRAGACLQVWRNEFAYRAMPDYCTTQAGYYAVGTNGRFWRSPDPDAVFVVRSGGATIATCRIADGECAVNLDD